MEDLGASIASVPDREVLYRSACLAIRKLTPRARWDDIPPPVQTAIQVIRAIRGASGHGVYWQGRPAWLTPERFAALDEESLGLRAGAQPFSTHHRWTPGGERARDLTRGVVLGFLEEIVGCPLGTSFATFNYYEREGEEAYAHVDQPEFELNLLGLLCHDHEGPRTSTLWVYPAGADPFEVALEPGEFVVFHGASTVHQRTPVGAGEHVRVVTASFQFATDGAPLP